MAGTRLDTAASGNTDNPSYPVSAGADRCLVIGIQHEGNLTPDQVSVTWGEQAMTQGIGVFLDAGGNDNECRLFYLLEAGIAAASGSTIAISGESSNFDWSAISYTGIDQTGGSTTVPRTNTNVQSGDSPACSATIAALADNVVIGLCGSGNGTTATWGGSNPLTEQTDQQDSGSTTTTGSMADRLITGDETVTAQCTWASQRRAALCMMELAAAAGGAHDLLADDVESAGEVSSPVVGQEHALLGTGVQSTSEVSGPALGQEHVLLADDVESTSEVSTPVLAVIHALLADDVESASEMTSPVIGQSHALLANDVESVSEVSSVAVGQEHALVADDVESVSEVTAPAVSESHALLAADVESASEVTVPTVGQAHAMLADDLESASEASSPSVGQKHALLADNLESASDVTAPVASSSGGDVLLADDVESASEVSIPALGQDHTLLAGDVEFLSELSTPTVGQEHILLADDVESASVVTSPVLDAVNPSQGGLTFSRNLARDLARPLARGVSV